VLCIHHRIDVPVGPAKFDVNRCNESPLWGEKSDFWPVSKFNTGSLPLCGILPVIKRYFLADSCSTGYGIPDQKTVGDCSCTKLLTVVL